MQSEPLTSETVENKYLTFSPVSHAFMVTLVPTAAIAAAAMLWLQGIPPTIVDLSAFAVMYTLSITGMTVGYHRHFTHQAFKAPAWLQTAFTVLGSMCGQGPVLYWVALHRRHHKIADQAGDPHSPYFKRNKELKGFSRFFHSHVGWVFDHDVPNTLHYARDLLQNRSVSATSSLYYLWLLSGFVIPGFVCGLITQSWLGAITGSLWGGPIRMIVGENAIWTITSLAHLVGSRPYKSGDQSRNIPILSVLTFGESWHNNHHAFPYSARFGLEWWQVDFGGWTIALLEKAGIIWDVNHPSDSQRNQARMPPQSRDITSAQNA